MTNRYWKIDFVRGIAIIMVIVFHLFFDLNYFGILENSMYSGFWLVFQRITASLFIGLVGVSLVLSFERIKNSKKFSGKTLFPKFLKRGLFLFAVALVITAATWIYPHKGFIVFGIIHFIALSVILGYFFLRFYKLNLILGIGTIIAGLWFSTITINSNLFFWLGLTFPGFNSLDYFPLFPWFGIVLIGLFAGKHLIKNYQNQLGIEKPKLPVINFMTFIGRKTLIIYLLHQPVIIGLIMVYLTLIL
ncbi:MAG: heparan-alpha-glucosaminide N-acetyltransferase [archaeon]